MLVGALLLGCAPPAAPPPATPAHATPAADDAALCGLPPRRRPDLLLAGSGSNLALVRAVAARFMAIHPAVRVEVPPSIGTSGAIAAVADGVIDVGLPSRGLRPRDVARGLVLTPYVRVPLALVAAPGVRAPGLAPSELLELMEGGAPLWPDGTARVLLLRERGDSGNRLLRRALPGYGDALDRALSAGRWRVCWTDQEQELALETTPGAVGLLDAGTARLGGRLRVLSIFGRQGVWPSGPSVPLKELGFLTSGPAEGLAAAFIAFARSSAVAPLLRRGGYELVAEEE